MTPLLLCLTLLASSAGQKVLVVAGAKHNPTVLGMQALGLPFERVGPGEYAAVSPFDYDLVVWGMDETRSPLAARPGVIRAFVEGGGVLLGFRANDPDPWLPSPAKRDKAFHLGPLLAPDHAVLNTPHRLDAKSLADVHGGSIYRALWDLGEGWVPLVATGAEQGWDKTPAAQTERRYGLAELPLGHGRIVLCQMIPAYHWFRDRQGDPAAAGAKLFENLVRYAMSQAGNEAANRPPRVVPETFHAELSDLLATPIRGDGLPFDDAWTFGSQGPFTRQTDRRGVLTFTHADQPSIKGSFAEVRRSLTVPQPSGPVLLRFYETDTYCGGRERVLGGADHGKTALENYKREMRYALVKVGDQVVWSEDVCGPNPHPGAESFKTVDITKLVPPNGGEVPVTLRVEDRAGSGELPFAIDVFFAAVEVITDLRHQTAVDAFGTPDGFEAVGAGLQATGGSARLVTQHVGSAGRYLVAVQLLDEVNGRGTAKLSVKGRVVAEWTLTADDQRPWWAASPVVDLRPGDELGLELVPAGREAARVEGLAVVSEPLLAKPPNHAEPPAAGGAGAEHVAFDVAVPETGGLARLGEVAVQGLPFPRRCLTDPSRVTVTAGERSLPVQTRVISRWPDGSAKTALVVFPADAAANGVSRYRVEAGRGVVPAAARGLTLQETADTISLDTGPLQVQLSKVDGRIFDEVRRGDQRLKPAGDAWELVVETEDGRLVRSGGPTVTSTEIVDGGPLRALIVRKGVLVDNDKDHLEYRLTVEATAESNKLRVESTLLNTKGELFLKRWSLNLAGSGAESARALVGDTWRAANDGAVLYQHREDTFTWTGSAGTASRQAGRLPGFVRLGGVAVGTRWFWERYPQAIRFSADATRFDFVPEALDEQDLPTRWRDRLLQMTDKFTVGGVGYPQSPGKLGLFRLSPGEALSQEVGFGFDGQAGQPADFAWLTDPLRAVPEPSYTASTLAFGEFHPVDPKRYARYEASTESSRNGYLLQREKRREYGFENYGDNTFEWGYGPSYTYWSNSEYDHHHGFALQYLRSGDPRWWAMCDHTARHYRDVVVNHAGKPFDGTHGGPRHHNAQSIWMPQDEEQYWIADHTMSGMSAGHSWVQGMIDYWMLTGDPWAEEVVHQLESWYCSIAEQNRFGAGGQERGPGWALIAISALARATGGERIMNAGRIVSGWLTDWQDPIRGVISVPISEQPSYEGGSVFMHGIVGRGLGRWYDVTGDPAVRDATIGIAEWITTEPMGEPGTFWYKQSPQNSKRYGATDQCLTALSYAYDLTGDSWFAEVSLALLERTGANVRSMSWYPQALAHLAKLMTPAVVRTPDPVIVAPDQPGTLAIEVGNTTDGVLTVQGETIAAEGFKLTWSGPLKIEAGGSALLTAQVQPAAAPLRVDAKLKLRLTTARGETVERRFVAPLQSVTRLLTIRLRPAEAELVAPVTTTDGYLHAPRDATFSGEPRATDGVSGGFATWSVDIPAIGDYVLTGEVKWLDEKGNSFFLRVDDQPETALR